MTSNVLTVLDQLQNITFSLLPASERIRMIREKQQAGVPVEMLIKYGVIHVDDKPIRVINHDGRIYYCLRDVIGGAGVTRGYHADMRTRIQQAAIEGPGAKNPAYYLPAEFLGIVVERARYDRSKRFVQRVVSSIVMPSDSAIDLLCVIQQLSIKDRELAFASWLDILRQSSLA